MPVHAVDLSTLVVAIDGPSGSGKSTAARGVARILGLRYLDTGAMYRALTWWVIEQGVDPADESSVLAAATTFDLDMSTDPVAQQVVLVSGHDVTRAIRSAAVTQQVSAVSAVAEVRRQLVARQRVIIGAGGIVVEGRDIGTTVCPAAPVKIFLTAATEARAVRRAREIEPDGPSGVSVVRADLDRRDRLDSGRAASPLHRAVDAVALDSTELDANQVIAAVLAVVRERTGIGANQANAGSTLDSISGETR